MSLHSALVLLVLMTFASCTEERGTPSNEVTVAESSVAPSPSQTISRRCHGNEGDTADVDGDGRGDLVYHAWVKGRARVGVCLGDGRSDAIPGVGQAETMMVLREDAVDRDVILFGATGMTENAHRLALWRSGRLVVVHDARTNQPLEARAGIDYQTGISWAWGWDCRINVPGSGADVHGALVQVRVKREHGELRWGARGYDWRNTRLATSGSSSRGSVENGDPLEFANRLIGDCRP